jgi:hypothetical protein
MPVQESPTSTAPPSKWSAARATTSKGLAAQLPAGLEKELCEELAAEEEEHVALLEGELEQL